MLFCVLFVFSFICVVEVVVFDIVDVFDIVFFFKSCDGKLVWFKDFVELLLIFFDEFKKFKILLDGRELFFCWCKGIIGLIFFVDLMVILFFIL